MVWEGQDECARRISDELCRWRACRESCELHVLLPRLREQCADAGTVRRQLFRRSQPPRPNSHTAEFAADAADSDSEAESERGRLRSEVPHTVYSKPDALDYARNFARSDPGCTLHRHARHRIDRLL